MENYICSICGKKFKRNENLRYHTDHFVCNTKDHTCKYCGSKFASKSTMYRHVREHCKVKKETDNEKEEILTRLLSLEDENKKLAKNNKKLEKENMKIKNQIQKVIYNNDTVNNCTTNINRGIINNIILVGYGNEDLSKLNKSEIIKALQKGFYSAVKLTETVHFNPNYPEYHNVYISNMKDKYAMMFDGENWTLTTKEELINKIYDDKKNYIEENLEDFIDSLPMSRKKALERWLNTDDEDPKIKEIKENIKLLLYNQRNLILEDKTNHIKTIK